MNLLQRFGRSSIRARLLLLAGVSAVVLVALFVTTRITDSRVNRAYTAVDQALQTIQSARTAIDTAAKSKDDVNRAAQNLMALRVVEKAFLQFHRAEAKSQFDQLAAQVASQLETLKLTAALGSFQEYRKAFEERAALLTQHTELKQKTAEPLVVSGQRLSDIQGQLEAKQSTLQMEGGTLRGDEAEMLNVARDCKIVFLRLQNLQQMFLNTGDQKYIEQYKALAAGDAQAGIRALREFATALKNESYQASAKFVSESLNVFLKSIEQSLAFSERERQLEQILDNRGEAILKAANDQLVSADQLVRGQQKNAQLANDEMQTARGSAASAKSTATAIMVAVILVGLLAFALASAAIIASINHSLNSTIAELDTAAAQTSQSASLVSSASQSLAEGASQQAASIEETSASLEEMSSMTQRNAETADKVNTLAKEARAVADTGVTDMKGMSSAMDEIKASSDDIAKIIKTIDEIAFQTNILALNAAVEAARAGEAGMGFAVVADEVRSLAQRSAQAARETAARIEGAITKSTRGVEISGKVAAALNDIVVKVREVDELVAAVASASREQSQGITQINAAVGEMDRVTQSNAANAEESASAAEELNAQAIVTREAIGRLLLLVGGRAAPPRSSEANRPLVPPPKPRKSVSAHQYRPAINGRSPAPALVTR